MPTENRKLTLKQQRFVTEYLKDPSSGTQAAIRAGCLPNSAHVTASKWLRLAKIVSQIDAVRGRVAAKIEEKTGITIAQVVEELAKVGFANMADYVRVQPDGTAYVDLSKATREQMSAVQEIATEEDLSGRGEDTRRVLKVKFKLGSKIGALRDIGEHLGMFPRGRDNGAGGGQINQTLHINWIWPEGVKRPPETIEGRAEAG